jgi:hypothetical protein
MTLILTWFFLCLAMFVLMWALGYAVQSYLYESIADQFVLRATIAGITLGCFYTFWVYVNTRSEHKDRYGVLQDFSPTATSEITEFTAVREYPNFKMEGNNVKVEKVLFKKTGKWGKLPISWIRRIRNSK